MFQEAALVKGCSDVLIDVEPIASPQGQAFGCFTTLLAGTRMTDLAEF